MWIGGNEVHQRVKILFVMPSFHTNIVHALTALKDRGAAVQLITSSRGGGAAPGVAVDVLDRSVGEREAKRILRAAAPDLVVVRKTKGLAGPFFRAALLARRPVLGYDQRPYRAARGGWHTLSGIARGRPPHRITPVYGLPGPRARPDPLATYTPFPVAPPSTDGPPDPLAPLERAYAPGGVPRILCVGKLAEARKDHELLLRVLERIDLPFILTFVGSTSLSIGHPDAALVERLLAYPTSGPIGARVKLLTDVPFGRMDEIYRAHDVCVLASRREPLGTAPVEAMARGCAAIVSDECGSAGYLAEAEAAGTPVGRIFRAGDPGALEAALREVLDPHRLARLGPAAAAWCARELSAERFAGAFFDAAAARGACVPPRYRRGQTGCHATAG